MKARQKHSFFEKPKQLDESIVAVFKNGGEYENQNFKNLLVSELKLYDIKIFDCIITNSKFTQTQIGDFKTHNVKFEDCDLANLKMAKTLIENTEFIKCRMTGFIATENSFRDVLFKDCQLKLSQFRFAKLKNVIFEDCILEEGDFYGAEIDGAEFINTNLIKAEMSSAKLKKTDFRTSQISGMKIGIDSLKGAVIDPTQVNDLAWLLGAKVEWKESANL